MLARETTKKGTPWVSFFAETDFNHTPSAPVAWSPRLVIADHSFGFLLGGENRRENDTQSFSLRFQVIRPPSDFVGVGLIRRSCAPILRRRQKEKPSQWDGFSFWQVAPI
jgi:hypothetical protein